jgi:hypothetical protein
MLGLVCSKLSRFMKSAYLALGPLATTPGGYAIPTIFSVPPELVLLILERLSAGAFVNFTLAYYVPLDQRFGMALKISQADLRRLQYQSPTGTNSRPSTPAAALHNLPIELILCIMELLPRRDQFHMAVALWPHRSVLMQSSVAVLDDIRRYLLICAGQARTG